MSLQNDAKEPTDSPFPEAVKNVPPQTPKLTHEFLVAFECWVIVQTGNGELAAHLTEYMRGDRDARIARGLEAAVEDMRHSDAGHAGRFVEVAERNEQAVRAFTRAASESAP